MTMKPAKKMKAKKIAAAFSLTAMCALIPLTMEAQQRPFEEKHKDTYAPMNKVPSRAAARPDPLLYDPTAVAAGEKLYGMHCIQCHGDMAQGARRGPSLLKAPVQEATPGALFWILTNGVVRRGMPVWSKLPEPERWQLVTYIKSLAAPPVVKRPDSLQNEQAGN